MAFRRRFLFLSEEDIIHENIKELVNKAQDISNLNEIEEAGLNRNHVMIIHIFKIMGCNKVRNFINKLTSFILKWINMYEEAESNSMTKIIDYFFSSDFDNFHIVFFIGKNQYIYLSEIDCVFTRRRLRQ